MDFIQFVGENHAVEVFGIRLVGINAQNGTKLLMTVLFISLLLLLYTVTRWVVRWAIHGRGAGAEFWSQQALHLGFAVFLVVGLLSIWFDDPARLATALGLVSAGLAFALQKVVTALAGYLVILRGKTFNVGDRIRMGGVRGDVIGLSFLQTTIMEMGEPPPVQNDEPTVWVESRQYTGRIVTVSNAKIFDEPVFNYTRDFPYLWDEMKLPIAFNADHARAERILLDAAARHTEPIAEMGTEALTEMRRRYFVQPEEMEPRVYYRLTDNWLELTVRYVTKDRGIRYVRDAMSRDILTALNAAGIGIASSTFAITELPPLRVQGPLPLATTANGRPMDGNQGHPARPG